MSAEQYHAAAGTSRSMLDVLSNKTPAHFKARFIDKLLEDEETPAQKLGTVAHRAILEPDTMTGAFAIKPSDMSFTTKEGKAWKAENGDRPIITASDASSINGMRDSVWRHPVASRILKSSEFERSLFAEDHGLLLKSRLDALPKTGNAVGDLKTCEDASLSAVEKAIFNLGYFRQAAFYLRVAKLLGLERDAFVFIFVEKTPPYCVACYQIVDEVMEAGRMMIDRDLHVLRHCYETNTWPGYSDGVEYAALPGWAMKQLEGIAA